MSFAEGFIAAVATLIGWAAFCVALAPWVVFLCKRYYAWVEKVTRK